MESQTVLFEICKQDPTNQNSNNDNDEKKDKTDTAEEEKEGNVESSPTNSGRFVRYQFTKEFLKLKTIGAL